MEPAPNRRTAMFDTNVVLDVLLERYPFYDEAAALWNKCDAGELDGHVAAVTLTTIFYVARKLKGAEKARDAVALVLRAFNVATVDRQTLAAALQMSGEDFEDNVQITCAQAASLEHIITRDPAGFAASPIPVVTPREMLAGLSAR